MGSKDKSVREAQKAYLEKKLNERKALLQEQGASTEEVSKDAVARQIRSKIRETNARLKAIESIEKKKEDLAALKKAKMDTVKEKEKKKKSVEPEEGESKTQQKKKAKLEKKKAQKDSGFSEE